MSQTPSFAEVLRIANEAHTKELRVAIPARVENYDAATQKVDAQPLILEGYRDENGDRQTERLPVVCDVPVVFPGSGPYRITFPVAAGDTVLLVFASSSIDKWLAVGGEVDPEDDRRHHISDAIAIPGLFDFAHVPTTAPTDAMVLHADKVRVGGPGAADNVARKSDLQTLKDAISAAVVVAADGGASFKSTLMTSLATWPICSQKVFSE